MARIVKLKRFCVVTKSPLACLPMPMLMEEVLFPGTSLAAWGTRMGRYTWPPPTQLQLRLWQAL